MPAPRHVHDQSPADLLIATIDARFERTPATPSPVTRQHEEEIRIVGNGVLSLCPTTTQARLIRSIPAEAELARLRYGDYAGHWVQVIESTRTAGIQTDFRPHEGNIFMRRTTTQWGDWFYGDSDLDASIAETVQDALVLSVLEGQDLTDALLYRKYGVPLTAEQAAEVIGWIALPAEA